MQKYANNLADEYGNGISGASVAVTFAETGLPATIYSDNGVTPIAALLTDSVGQFAFYAADGRYSITTSKPGVTTGTLADIVLEDPETGLPEAFGAVADGVTNSTSAILSLIISSRGTAAVIDDGLGGGDVTAYPSGVVELGYGTYVISPDTFDNVAALGLTLRGKGSRGSNNSVRAPTTLLVSGTSSGFGIRAKGNGARAMHFEDLDICYADAGFTGHLLDLYGAPGATLTRCYLGTYGITGATRLRTAASLIRATYDEFLHCIDCVFDGAVDGVLFDNSRGAYEFGGSCAQFDNCVFYDFTGTMIKQSDALRSRRGLVLNSCAFNPITVAGVRALDMSNLNGLVINGGIAIGSVGHAPSQEWMRLVNTTGTINGFQFGDYAKAGTLAGMIDVSNCVVDATAGLTPVYGVITGKGNRVRYGAEFWNITAAPTSALTIDLGPDLFAVDVVKTYNITSTSSLINGRVRLAREQDSSTTKWENSNPGVLIGHDDRKVVAVTGDTTISILDSGRTIAATGSGTQQFSVPAPKPGTRFRVTTGAFNFTLVTSGGYPFYTGAGGVKTSMSKVAADVGGVIDLDANGTAGWFVKASGTWSYA